MKSAFKIDNWLLTIFSCALLMVIAVSSSATLRAEDGATKKVTIKELTLELPESWMKRETSNQFRLAEFEIPAPKADQENAELVLFHFQGAAGTTDANIKRWISQFEEKGTSFNVKQGKLDSGSYVWVDISGTYKKPVGPPILGRFEKMEDARVVSVILNTGDDAYYLKLSGKQEVIKEVIDGFRKSFGGNAETETDYEFEI